MRAGLKRTLAQFSLLGRAPAFRNLFAAAFVSNVGNWFATVALTVAVYDRTHSARWVSVLLVAQFLPGATAGVALSPLVDRLPRRRLLVGSDLLNAFVFVLASFVAARAGLLIVVALSSSLIGALFNPATLASIPNLVEEEEVTEASGLFLVAMQASNLGGSALAGVLLLSFHVSTLFLLDAASFVLSASLLAAVRGGRFQQAGGAATRGHLRDLLDGLGYLWGNTRLRRLIGTWGVVVLGISLQTVGQVLLAKHDLHAGSLGYSLLLSAEGGGLALGGLIGAALLERFGPMRVYRLSLLTMAAGFLVAALSPTLWLALGGAFVAGIGNMAAMVVLQVVIQQDTPDSMRGRAFATVGGLVQITFGAALALAGPIDAVVEGRGAWTLAALLSLVALVLSANPLGRGETSKEAESPPLAHPSIGG